VVRVEAPGLSTDDGVEVSVEGCAVEVRAPARVAPSDGLLFSTRPFGSLYAKIVLPRPANPPAVTTVENGLITVALAGSSRGTPAEVSQADDLLGRQMIEEGADR
jgi:HSP20 family molecular chaperone IbpA